MVAQVSINEKQCEQIALKIKGAGLRKSFYERPFLRIDAPDEIRLRGYFYAVAICHQTYHLHNKELNLYGWDYLEHVFTGLIAGEAELLRPGYFASLKPKKIEKSLAELFPISNSNSETSLDRLEERAAMLAEFDWFIHKTYNSSLSDFIQEANRLLFNNGSGFYEVLPQTIAFSDPFRKKITFLLKLLEEASLVVVKDPENFVPIMDYHMQRVLMRTGCIDIEDRDYHVQLIGRVPQADDTVVRHACIEAFKLIAKQSGHAITKLNDFFWSLGRSCCNEKPICQVGVCEKNPCTFFEIVDIKEHNECYFKLCCKGYEDQTYRNLWQPVVNTHYY